MLNKMMCSTKRCSLGSGRKPRRSAQDLHEKTLCNPVLRENLEDLRRHKQQNPVQGGEH